ncbi:double-stranded RNA-binding protein Staufen homolog [Anopheles funestus]|uniref:double-stranded RNA-binding protein Staufen homolog n=1 Tax=Anopheles funestus TaxID=62324 RepID=UPI0020C67592|nr:double-stranded RNA-binding protein Staufen homolog [Anopheles funestus]
MHGHMAPQQHPGMHPAHQPPPHLTHLTSLPPHNIQRDHPANRLTNARHHHPRGVDHQGAGMAPHLPMQVPPPTHQPSQHQSQNARKPPPGPSYYNMHSGIPKSMPLTTPHLHPSPPGLGVGPQPPQPLPPHQQHMGSISHPSVVGGNHPPGPGAKIPYGMGGGGGGGGAGGSVAGASMSVSVHHPVTMQAPPPIPVVSAATPAGTKTRHIPSNTDHKVHHGHGHSVLQSNGNCGPGSKGIANNHHQTNQTGTTTMDKTKVSAGTASSGGNRHHHNHHHSQHQQQHQHQPQQQILSKPNDAPIPKDSVGVTGVTVSAASVSPSVANVAATMTNQPESAAIATSTPANGGTLSVASCMGDQSGAPNQLAPAQHSPTDSIEALANIKEKTTMCLVNELARYNKIQHQYRLTGESGPAHKKHFTVTLKLGDEEYTAEGASIKKAQHKAAGDAIAATKYKHPPARTNRRTKTGTKGNVSSFTPTVELNALAMKRGEPTVYTVKAVPVPVSKYGPANGTNGGPVPPATGGRRPVEDKSAPGVGHPPGVGFAGAGRYANEGGNGTAGAPAGNNGYWCRATGPTGIAAGVGGRGGMGGFHPGHQQQQQHHGHHPRDDHQNRHHASHNYHHHEGYGHHHGSSAPVPSVQEFYKATLRVGERTFLGEGHTPQAARHDAAARALEVLKPLTADSAEGKGKPGDSAANGDTLPSDGTGTSADGYDPNAELKSPISLVHEIAVQRSLTVVFEVISEKGPPHMTVFVTQCKVGTIVTEGEGTGKKLSKKRAAEKMLEELRKLQSVEQQTYPPAWGDANPAAQAGGEKRKSNAKSAAAADGATAKKKARNLIKEKSIADVAEKENPISRLMQIQQARKEKQPVYTLVENDRPNVGRRRQFTIEVSASGRQATGVGMTKKAAKWSAAEALLVELGYATEPKGGTGSTGGDSAANKENQSGVANDSSPPGGKRSRKVRFQDEQRNGVPSATQMLPNATSSSGANQGKGETSNDSMNDSIASNDSMGTNSSGVSSASSAAPKADIGAKKEQLLYLAQLLKFEVQFSDFPKGNHGEYLTLVILSTEPNQLCHGSGASLQESHDEAARGALEILSKIGLDNIKPKAPANNAPDDATSSAAGASSTATLSSPGTSNIK